MFDHRTELFGGAEWPPARDKSEGLLGVLAVLPGRPSRLAVALVLGLTGLSAAPALAADDDPIGRLENAIERLEAQHQAELKQLQDQISQLTAQQSKIEKQLKQLAPAPDMPKLIEAPKHQFGMY